MDTKGLQKEFIDWCKSNKKQPKSKEETQQLFVTFMKEKHPEEYKAAMENQQKQAQKALHGAKLQYIRSLKNQCAEGEELYYYKKGGSVGCGCKKKEDGGEIKKAESGWRANFDNRKNKKEPDQATKDSIAVNKYGAEDIEATKPGSYKKNKEGKIQWTPDRTKAPYNKTSKKEKGGKAEKDCGGFKMKLQKKGGEVCPKCGKVHAAGMGCTVAKFKMHHQGGSLNGIPFMQQGTFKGGVQYRFRRSTNDMNNGYKTYSDQIMMTQDPLGHQTYDTPPISAGRTIYVTPQRNDTIFYTNNDYIFDKTPKGDLNQKKAKQKFYQLIKKAPIEGEEYRMTPYWNSNLFNLDAVRNRALKGN